MVLFEVFPNSIWQPVKFGSLLNGIRKNLDYIIIVMLVHYKLLSCSFQRGCMDIKYNFVFGELVLWVPQALKKTWSTFVFN